VVKSLKKVDFWEFLFQLIKKMIDIPIKDELQKDILKVSLDVFSKASFKNS
jgi:hypothetical protein